MASSAVEDWDLNTLRSHIRSKIVPFLEKALPATTLFLAIPIVSNAQNRLVFLGLLILHPVGNVLFSKYVTAHSPKNHVRLELYKVLGNGLYIMGVHWVFGADSPFWLLQILSIIRVPVVFVEKSYSVFSIIFLSLTASLGLIMSESPIDDVLLATCTLLAIGLLSIVLFQYLNTVFERLIIVEQQVRDQEVKLTAASKWSALGEMAAGLAHEINNPLMVINGYADKIAEKLKNQKGQEETARFAEKIDQNVHRISRIVAGLKIFSRDSSGDAFVHESVRGIVERTLDLCQERFEKGGVHVIEGDMEKDLKIWCNSIQVEEVLINLLNNAYDAVKPPDAWIKIEVLSTLNSVEIRVSNSGPPIDPKIRTKIHEPFFTTKAPGKGTGLGLSISKEIMEKHGGKMELDETVKHTQFVLHFPHSTTQKH